MYDYLIVGSGLFGSVFAYEMKKKGYSIKVIEKERTLEGIFIVRKLKVLMYINMVLIFFTLMKKKSGNM